MNIDLRPILDSIPNNTRGFDPDIFKNLSIWHDQILNYAKKNIGVIFNFHEFDIELNSTNTGSLTLPHLVGPHELIIFKKYLNLKKMSNLAIDLGANVGLHSILLAKLGYEVFSYEPDPITFNTLEKNANTNKVKLNCINSAIAPSHFIQDGIVKFTKVLDNPTASGINNTSKSFYGNVELINVNAISVNELQQNADIIKMDIEGAEFEILQEIFNNNINFRYMNVEISNSINRDKIYELIKRQNLSFNIDRSLINNPEINQLPTNWREGSLHLFNDYT